MPSDDRQEPFDAKLARLLSVYPQLSVDRSSLSNDWPRCRLYVAQVVALEQFYSESVPPLSPRADFCILLSNACWFLFEQGLLGQSMQMLSTALAVGEATQPESRFALSNVHRAFGGILLDLNKPDDALTHFSKILELGRHTSELATAKGLVNVALVELSLEQTAAAKEKIAEAEEIYSRHPKEAEGYRAIMLDVSGLAEAQAGDLQKGIQRVRQAIALYDKNAGPRNYWSAFANYEIGNMYIRTGQLDEALDCHELALSVQQDKLGETYITAACLHKVAWHLHHIGAERGAEELLLKALKIYGEIYEGKGGLARSNYLLHMVLAAQGRKEDAANCKIFAGALRLELVGKGPDQDDNLASYDLLVGYQFR